MKEQTILIAMQQDDPNCEHVGGAGFSGKCTRCHKKVHLAPTSKEMMEKYDCTIVCNKCIALEDIAPDDTIIPISDAQVREIKQHLINKRAN